MIFSGAIPVLGMRGGRKSVTSSVGFDIQAREFRSLLYSCS